MGKSEDVSLLKIINEFSTTTETGCMVLGGGVDESIRKSVYSEINPSHKFSGASDDVLMICGNDECINSEHMVELPSGYGRTKARNLIRTIRFYTKHRVGVKSDGVVAEMAGISAVSLCTYLKEYRDNIEYWDNVIELRRKYEKDNGINNSF